MSSDECEILNLAFLLDAKVFFIIIIHILVQSVGNYLMRLISANRHLSLPPLHLTELNSVDLGGILIMMMY